MNMEPSSRLESSVLPRPGAKVSVETIKDATGKSSGPRLVALLRSSLQAELSRKKLLADRGKGDFGLHLRITEYEPGTGLAVGTLKIKGELRDTRTGAVAVTINHQQPLAPRQQDPSTDAGAVDVVARSAAAFALPEVYGPGSLATGMDQVAKIMVKDLKFRIEEGGKFRMAPPSRAGRKRARPQGQSLSVRVMPVIDQRPGKGRIGRRTAAFDVPMSDVYLTRPADAWFGEVLRKEVELMGHRVVSRGEDLRVTPRLTRLWIETETTPVYWDVVARVECEIDLVRGGGSWRSRKYSGSATRRTYVSPSEKVLAGALDKALDDLFDTIRADPAWR